MPNRGACNRKSLGDRAIRDGASKIRHPQPVSISGDFAADA
jgi:hypothetical protein